MAACARVSIRPSALGVKGALLFCALELAFLATNYSNLFFLLLVFSASLGATGAYWAHRNLRGVLARLTELPMAAAGSERPVAMHLRFERPRPRFDVSAELRLDKGFVEIAHTHLCVGDSALQGVLAPQPRGVHSQPVVRLTSRFPFGFFVAHANVPFEGELVTYPRPEERDASPGQRSRGADGAHLAAGNGSTLAGLRAFRTGDSIADVHWKATARRGAPVVKERERESSPALEVVFDRRCDADLFEATLSQLTSMAESARHNTPLTIHSQNAELTIDPDRGGATDTLHWLASATPLPADAPAPPTRRGVLQLPNESGARR